MTRTISVVTTSRADFGILRPVVEAIDRHEGLRLSLFAAGTHLSPEHGLTIGEIESQGWRIDERVEALLSSTTPEGVAKSSALTTLAFAQIFAKNRPDILLVLGDRYEVHAAVVAAVPFNIPVAHIHGGELTYGAVDDAFRHSITKMAHLHFPATEDYAKRLRQMGEEDWRIVVSGAPALDSIMNRALPDRAAIEQRFGLSLAERPLLVTYHPATREAEPVEAQIAALLGALEALALPVIFTGSNADAGGQTISQAMRAFAAAHANAAYVESLGADNYLGLLRHVRAMVGNSSSGIIEAPSFALPVVNIGSRQAGRMRAANVIDCAPLEADITRAIERALSPDFAASLKGLRNPYGAGNAGRIIADTLAAVPLDARLLAKRFCDVEGA
jgi:UDP-hydrolysing UDP-N-acetyl-D-glucosamine 2-epimerase